MPTDVSITNAALAQIGTHAQITSLTDGSEEARYANLLYLPLKDFLLTEGDYDFSLTSVGLTIAVGIGSPWAFSYAYPAPALRIRSLVPVEHNITSIAGVRYIETKVAASTAIYTYSASEAVLDPIFTEAFTRLLASTLAFALENRIEASKDKLTEALNFAGIANLRDP
jgi:hypothetical protein